MINSTLLFNIVRRHRTGPQAQNAGCKGQTFLKMLQGKVDSLDALLHTLHTGQRASLVMTHENLYARQSIVRARLRVVHSNDDIHRCDGAQEGAVFSSLVPG